LPGGQECDAEDGADHDQFGRWVAGPGATVSFQCPKGFSLKYPAAWSPYDDSKTSDSGVRNSSGADPDQVLSLAMPADAAGKVPKITVDVPVLPPHIPGLIPINLVESGFVDDLHKRYKTVHEDKSVGVNIPGAVAVQATIGVAQPVDPNEDRADVIQVLLAVHGDGVYIIDAETTAAAAESARLALKTMAESLQWTK
jgi:hypothetical protein